MQFFDFIAMFIYSFHLFAHENLYWSLCMNILFEKLKRSHSILLKTKERERERFFFPKSRWSIDCWTVVEYKNTSIVCIYLVFMYST